MDHEENNLEDTSSSSEEGQQEENQGSENQNQDENQNQVNKKSAESRINELVAESKEKEKLLEEANRKLAYLESQKSSTSQTTLSPQAQKTASFLQEIGFETKDSIKKDLDERDRLLKERLSLEMRHESLERKYDGSNGLPKYDRSKIEDAMRNRGIYGDPEDAFKLIFENEFDDWKIKQAEVKRKKAPTINQGMSNNQGSAQTITRADIAEWVKTPEGRLKYERNRDKIMELMRKGLL